MAARVSVIPSLARHVHGARLARFGTWGLAFFALKGLVWLLLPLIAMYLA